MFSAEVVTITHTLFHVCRTNVELAHLHTWLCVHVWNLLLVICAVEKFLDTLCQQEHLKSIWDWKTVLSWEISVGSRCVIVGEGMIYELLDITPSYSQKNVLTLASLLSPRLSSLASQSNRIPTTLSVWSLGQRWWTSWTSPSSYKSGTRLARSGSAPWHAATIEGQQEHCWSTIYLGMGACYMHCAFPLVSEHLHDNLASVLSYTHQY